MWPFAKRENIASSIVARLETVEKVLQRVADELVELQDKHARLKGRVYNQKLHKRSADDEDEKRPVDEMTREELRRYAFNRGVITPGKPTKHD